MNIDTSPESLARMAAQGLRLDPPPTEAEINDVLTRLAIAFGAGQSQINEALKLLHARFSIRMEMGQTIQREHVPWLAGRIAEIDPFYWDRYRELLMRTGWSPQVAGILERSMNDLLDLLGNPADTGPGSVVASWSGTFSPVKPRPMQRSYAKRLTRGIRW